MKIIYEFIPGLDNFTTIPNRWVRDRRMSYRARGILCALLSHDEGWHTSTDALARECAEGRDAVRTAVRELERYGYLKRRKPVTSNGQYGPGELVIQNPHAGFQSVDSTSGNGESLQVTPRTEKPPLDFQAYKKTNQKKNVSSDDETSSKNTPKRNDYPQDFKDFWEAFPKRSGTNSKREAHKAWAKAIKEETPANLFVAAKNYAKATADVENLSTIPMCSSWLNKGYWEQYVGAEASPVDLLRKWWKDADVEAVTEHTGLRFSMSWPDVIPESQAERDELVFNARREWIASVRDDAIAVLKGAAA